MPVFIRAFLLVLAAVLFFGAATAPGVFAISLGKEKELAEEFIKVVRRRYDIIEDPFLTGYINDVGQRLIRGLPPQPFEYRFYLIRSDVYNAFAGPGGHICINSGLLQAMDNEDQLAVSELELIEPELWFRFYPEAAELLAKAIKRTCF